MKKNINICFLKYFILSLFVLSSIQSIAATNNSSDSIRASFLKQEDSHDYFVMVSKQMEMLKEFESGKSMYDMSDYSVDAKMQVSGSSLILTTTKSDEYMIFGTSDLFLKTLYSYGGRHVRYNSDNISVEFSLADKNPETNYTRIMVATIRPRKTLGDAWHISSFSGNKSEKFTARFKLDKYYKKDQLKVMTYNSQGRAVDLDAKYSIIKIGKTYYAKVQNLTSGTYAIVKR